MTIESNPVFKSLTHDELMSFIGDCEEQEFAAGSVLIQRGEHGEAVFFLLEGELSVRLPRRNSNQEMTRLQPPAVVGEIELLSGQTRTADVVALTTTKVLAHPLESFREKMAAGDLAALKVAANFAHILAHRMGALTDHLVALEAEMPEERSAEMQSFRAKLFSDWSC